jgi:hypothetical protein
LALRLGVPAPMEPLKVAAALGMEPPFLHRLLLEADEAGQLSYRAVGRERLYAFLDTAPSAASDLNRRLQFLEHHALADLAGVETFLDSPQCRWQSLRWALTARAVPPCGRCDNCLRAKASCAESRLDPSWLALSALASVPFGLPHGAALRAIQSAMRTAGYDSSRTFAQRLLEGFLTGEAVVTRDGHLGPLLAVSAEGRNVLRGETT